MSSGNSLDYSKEDWDQMAANEAAVKEMEAAGISWIAHLHGVPFLAVKSITDIVDGDRPPQEEFLENLHAAAQALQVSSFLSPLCFVCRFRLLLSVQDFPEANFLLSSDCCMHA